MNEINLNTYKMLPRWFISLALTKKYTKLTNKDLKKGYYFNIEFLGITVKISFKSLFGTNSKIKGIKSIEFDNATLCTSYRLGLCQIPIKKYCYAYNFESIYYNDYNDKSTYFKFGAYFKGFLMRYVLRMLKNDKDLKNKFFEYVRTLKTVRFNVNSDIRTESDYLFIVEMALSCQNVVFYGYTARNDILDKYYKPIANLTVNGSNKCYTNRYYATMSLKEYFLADNKCIGSCLNCGKCFKFKNKTITTLFHHSNADSILNTKENRLFIVELVNAIDIDIKLTESDLKVNKGIFTSLNKALTKYGCDDLKKYDINSIKGFLDYIWYMPKAEFKDLLNGTNYNKDILKGYGLI